MTIQVLVRGVTKEEEEFLGKMMSAAKIEDWKLIDILIENVVHLNIGIAIGQICGRQVQDKVKKLFVLPTIKQLKPNVDENRVHRQEAWTKLQEIKDFLEGKDTGIGDSWQYATVCLPGQKKIVIYETAKPPHVEGDIFISRKDSNLLLKMKEAFRAEAVLIGEEN